MPAKTALSPAPTTLPPPVPTPRQAGNERELLLALNDLMRRLSTLRDPEALLSAALDGVIGLFGAHGGTLIALDDDGQAAHCLIVGDGPDPDSAPVRAALRSLADARLHHPWRVNGPDGGLLLAPIMVAETPVALLALTLEHGVATGTEETLELVAGSLAGIISAVCTVGRLHASVKARQRVTFQLVHDIRSPLMATHAGIEIARRALQDTDPHPFVHDALNSALRSLRSVLDLTNDLLDVARLQSHVQALHYQEIDLEALFADVAAQMHPLAAERGLRIELSAPPAITASGDARLLRRVLVNLLSNALRFAPAGSAVVLRAAPAAGGAVCLAVEDAGPGVAAADRERIFAPFVQGQGEAHRGAGMGLAFCREVAKAHGGRIWVEDRPGGGSIFAIELPPAPAITPDRRP